ncbi:MAG: hypothetical protein ACK5Q8_06810 [Phycisphaerales bacterium]|jgi:hypothetical protein|nr:hypothetical protein [Phycisphaeraceae bacterium]
MAPGSSCDRCGYDVSGLPMAGRCPECGTPFDGDMFSGDSPDESAAAAPGGEQRRRKSAAQLRELPLMAASDEDLRSLSRAAILMQVGLVGFAGVMLAAWIFIVLRSQNWLAMDITPYYRTLARYMSAAGFLLLTWFVGQVLLTARRGVSGVGGVSPFAQMRSYRVRALAHLSVCAPLAWLAVMLAIGVSMWLGGPSDSAGRIASLIGAALVLLAGALMVPLCLVFFDLAEFLRDDFATDRFRTGVFAMPILCALYGASMLVVEGFSQFAGVTRGFSGLLLLFLTAILAIPVIPFFAGVCSLASSCRWAIRNKHERIEREKRFLERARRAAAKAAGEPLPDSEA